MTRATQARAAAVLADARWAAVCARDAGADGSFVFAVRTTGVFCRPSCASRRARPENVEFHPTPALAARAGFRACKRCTPERAAPADASAGKVAALCRLIERSATPLRLGELARAAGLSPFHTHRLFKQVTGVTPRQYGAARRAERVRAGLRDAGASVTEAIYDAGYGSSGRFYDGATRLLGMTPTRYQRGGDAVAMRFAVAECALGAILVAASARGVCAILLGDDPEALVRDLERRFPRAEIAGGDAAFEALVARVVGLVDEPRQAPALPLDVRGTAFQERVWRALARIPAGETRTYAEVARAIGAPTAARAVAQACAANPLAVAIPCHRVVRGDGALAGYRWGVARKRALLAEEARPLTPAGAGGKRR